MSQVQRQPKKKTPRSRNLFKRTTVMRLGRAAVDAGFDVHRFEVDPSGRVSVIVSRGGTGSLATNDEVENWLSKQKKNTE